MFENIKILKTWWKVAKPSKKYFIISTLAMILSYSCIIISPIFAAKVIIAINASNWWGAVLYLTIVFGLLVLERLFYHVNYLVYAKLIESVFVRLNNEVVDKIYKSKNSNFKKTPKEKLLNILHTEIFNLGDTADKAAMCIAKIFRLIVTIIIIFVINVWVGLAILICDVFNFLLLNHLENKRAQRQRTIREDIDEQYTLFSEIVDSKDMVNDLNLNKTWKRKYSNHLSHYISDLHKKTMADSSIGNYFYVFYHFMIFILTLGSVVLTARGTLSIETYFIIIPYITAGIETTNSVFEFMPYLKNSAIYVNRVQNILNFTEKPNLEFGDIDNDEIVGFVDFNNVHYKADKENNPAVKNIDLHINALQTTLIYGTKRSGKRTIFKLLHRELAPTKGQINLDGLDIMKYSKKTYTSNFNYLSTHPMFFDGSILYNLKMVNKNKNDIINVLEKMHLLEYINSLPNKIYTNVLTLPFDKQYLVGFARTLLTQAEVIALYEFPTSLTFDEKQNLLNLINALHGKRTIIIFSANDKYAEYCDKIVTIEKGEITHITRNNLSNNYD